MVETNTRTKKEMKKDHLEHIERIRRQNFVQSEKNVEKVRPSKSNNCGNQIFNRGRTV